MKSHDSGTYTKEDIIELAKVGKYIPTFGEICENSSLDGSNIKVYLEKRGFTVIENYDTGNNGIALTKEGIQVSTNGYCSMIKK